MVEIKPIDNDQLKSDITDAILHQLPNWFGIEESIQEYIESVKDKVFYAVYDGNDAVGFICLKMNNPYTAEIYVMGILEQYHRCGIGRNLVNLAEQYVRKNQYKFFMVKTVGDSSDDEYYRRTRAFYRSVGFYPLEEIKEIWDEKNPCLIMVKYIG
jgi:ribosomal protein S18 acetylase RimI-like enzyme